MAKHFSKAERLQIEKSLLTFSRKLFLAKGIRAMSVERLCEVAQISKGTFYSFYESKFDLFLAIAEAQEKAGYDKIIEFTDIFIGESTDYVGQLFDQIHEIYLADPIIEIATRPKEFEQFIQKVSKERWDEYWAFGKIHCHDPLTKLAIDRKLIRASAFDENLLQELVSLLGQIATRRNVLHEKRYRTHIGHLRDTFIFKLAINGETGWL